MMGEGLLLLFLLLSTSERRRVEECSVIRRLALPGTASAVVRTRRVPWKAPD
jgi:hypothetical protein